MKIQVVILAAGSSSRLGQPKQLVSWQGKPLIQYVAEQALRTSVSETKLDLVLITGAYAEPVTEPVRSQHVIHNANWSEGMASSVRIATEYAMEQQADAQLFLLTDQPYVDAELLQNLIQTYKEHPGHVIVSDYGTDWGVPLIIDSTHYAGLLTLTGDRGVKRYVQQHQLPIKKVKFLKGLIDIDTEQDLRDLQERQ